MEADSRSPRDLAKDEVPDFRTLPKQMLTIFQGKPDQFLESKYGPITAHFMEAEWRNTRQLNKQSFGYEETRNLLEWLPSSSRDTFIGDCQKEVPGAWPSCEILFNASKRKYLASFAQPIKRQRVKGNLAAKSENLYSVSLTDLAPYSLDTTSRYGILSSDTVAQNSADLVCHPPSHVPKHAVEAKSTGLTSPFWASTEDFARPYHDAKAVVPFAQLDAAHYGLIQEELADDPFRLLVAVIFLTKTRGLCAIPAMRTFFDLFPSPESLADAQPEDVFPDIHHLGLGNRRACALIKLARKWLESPPTKGERYRRINYPEAGCGKDILKSEEPVDDDDMRSAFEVCHLPKIGVYGIDSWRIFCRDSLRGIPSGVLAKAVTEQRTRKENAEAVEQELAQEWTRVRPTDKELQGYIKWRWMRLGWIWEPKSGDRKKIKAKILKKLQRRELERWDNLVNPWI